MYQTEGESKFQYRSLSVIYKAVKLTMHRNFTTAHSTSATRINFFIKIGSSHSEKNIFGYGQCGLPPKKPGCYLSDINDCFSFMEFLSLAVKQQGGWELQCDMKKLNIPGEMLQKINSLNSELKNDVMSLILVLQDYDKIEHYRAPKCALQFALIDLLAKNHRLTITELLFNSKVNDHLCYSFYTASLEKQEQMIQNIRDHLSITKFIKIKYNNQIQSLVKLLKRIFQQFDDTQIQKVIVDANCSWSPSDFHLFTQLISDLGVIQAKIAKKLLYIEQPFDLDITDFQLWRQIKAKSPFNILADESFRNQFDIVTVQEVAHAVNIKTEKTGGLFSTLRAGIMVKEAGLQVMFGSMCSTQLGCTQTYQFFPLAKYLDIDGSLLVKDPQVQGGFVWSEEGRIIPFKEGFGLRVNADKFFEV